MGTSICHRCCPKKSKNNNNHVIRQPHSWAYIQTKLSHKNACSPMFIAAVFTIAKTWKKLKCSSTDKWIKKMWYIYTVEYYSVIKKSEIMPFVATRMKLEILILNGVRTRKTNIVSLIFGI
uniref:Uncharacterized protein n=1 Tax=Sus scrofa TaxID=9823 RepID=A0A8D0LME6_PIG